jgi:trk system potassium uptake protein
VRVHSLRRGAAEAIEAIAHGIQGEGRVIGKRVEEIPLPDGTTIGAIVRGDEVLIAHHDTMIQRDDHVILFLTDRRHVEVVERLFDVPRRKGR